MQDGLVTLIGRGAGSTNVIVIAGDETVTLRVLVAEPPLIILPGMGRTDASSGASGYYEARYGSNPGVIHGGLFVSRRDGERSAELTLGGAAPLGGDIASPFSIPQASFTLRTPNREVTLLDRVISNSPLTISRSNVRGLHVREGPWQVHAGYSFFSTFEHLLLPTEKEAVTGVAYRQPLTSGSSLTSNVFYFGGLADRGPHGALGSFVYEARRASDVKFMAELAVSRSLGGALELEFDRPNRRGWAKVRLAPPDLPSLTTDRQSGRQVESGWIWQGEGAGVTATLSSRRYAQGPADHTSSVASVDVQRRLSAGWSIHGGSGMSIFENSAQAASRISHLTLPVGTSFSGRHGAAAFDYQFSRETARDLGGHLFRVNLNASAGGFRASAYGERQTQAPTARYIFTEIPWLQPMLDRLGLAASSPQQIAELLRTNAELSAFGYANSIQLDVTPARARLGAGGGWSGSGMRRPQLSANTLFNRDESVGGTSLRAMHSLSYSQKLDGATEVFLTWSALCDGRFGSPSCRPLMFASLRRGLGSGPRFLAPRAGHIEGVVFKDDGMQGVYTPGSPPVPGVEVVLDNLRYARTDSAGRFRFDDVPHGRHRVEVRYAPNEPLFFTTPSPADVDTGSSVHFGVAQSRATLRGAVLSDGGSGLAGVLVHIVNGDGRTAVRTSDDGTFVQEGLAAGDYEVSIDAGSVPPGYPVRSLEPQRVRVEHGAPGRAQFVLRPSRSVAGRARRFDRVTGRYVALAGVNVEFTPLGQRSVTDASGHFNFRNLPAGQYTVVAKYEGGEYLVPVSVPDGPALVKDIEIAVPGTPGSSLHSRTAEPQRLASEARPQVAAGPSAESGRSGGAGGAFTIDVAASGSARHARAMVDELQRAGHPAYLERGASPVDTPYRVRVGHFHSLADATRSARTLEKALGWQVTVTQVAAGAIVRNDTRGYGR